MCRWPKLYFTDISEYLRLKTPQELYYRLCNEYKQGKAYRYFTSGWVKKICYHSISTTSKICFLTAKVSASMRTSMPPYQVWAAIEKDTPSFAGGRIFSAYCTCTAGLHGSCNHIAGLLFRVECAVRTGMTSCTSQACTWNVPRDMKSISKPTPLKDLVWKKDQYFNQDGDDTFAQSVKVLATKFTPMTAPQKEYIDSDQSTTDLSSKLRSINPNCCFMQLYDGKPFPSKKKLECPKTPQKLADEVKTSVEDPETAVENLLTAMKVDKSKIEAICRATADQRDSNMWFQQRKGRITSSNIHRVHTRVKTLKKDPSQSVKSLLSALLDNSGTIKTVAMKHGIALEPHAKIVYSKQMRKKHKVFTVKDTGLHVCKDKPFLAASPDLLISCKCHGKGLCEIKCPYLKEAPSPDNWPHLKYINGCTKLSSESTYFFQVQSQMGIVGAEFCDFFVYTPCGFHLERVLFDSVLFAEMAANAEYFWRRHLCPVLLQGSLQNRDHTDHSYAMISHVQHSSISHTDCVPSTSKVTAMRKSKLPHVFLCGVCGLDVLKNPLKDFDNGLKCVVCQVSHHMVCVGLRESDVLRETGKWICDNCV
ncbi:uncharacterized protein LOC594793 isoform X2 [Strongylocentrotus purpuratus]|nr:uncharacterized protein LOC594793 isoform X2 [Strongylocentrotus purpuratus]XP_030832600.1 uncharacterized protein LOC594793 isoform X2 [Strongylocentrotus purpuratus]XP_030832606.1 uncharacterized protein LOC594793 isoform X2 [Strongylocentrotus purpuratus]XP_030832611.1 uncharacterized protein LOC594793 isoform X2 [Strongylocentrotus purpuratus]